MGEEAPRDGHLSRALESKQWSHKRSRKGDGIGVARIRTFPFSLIRSSENKIVRGVSRSRRIKQSQGSSSGPPGTKFDSKKQTW